MGDRIIKIEGVIKEAAANFILHEANTNPMITVTRVDISPDLKKVIIFITTIPDGREADALIFLKRSASDMRSYMKKNVRLKQIPHIDFMVDAGEKHRQHMDELIRDIADEKKK